MTLLDEHSKVSTYVTFPLLAGIGLGMLFHAPYQVFTRALKPSELASATSAFFLVRFTGATVGLVGIIHSVIRPLADPYRVRACRLSRVPFFRIEQPVAFLQKSHSKA